MAVDFLQGCVFIFFSHVALSEPGVILWRQKLLMTLELRPCGTFPREGDTFGIYWIAAAHIYVPHFPPVFLRPDAVLAAYRQAELWMALWTQNLPFSTLSL